MIDLDVIEQAARKPWYCRSKQEDNLLSPEILVELVTRLRMTEKLVEKYRERDANNQASRWMAELDDELSRCSK